MPQIPTISLKAVPMQFAAFTPAQYTQEISDPEILRKSLIEQETRQEKANQYATAVDAILNEKQKFLNPADYDWLNEQANIAREEVDKQLALGNWQSAIRVAQKSARDLARNTEFNDRIKANEVYTTERNKIQNGNYDDITKRRWDTINKYNFNGTPNWTPTFKPTVDRSITDVWNLAVNSTPVRSNNNNHSKDRNITTFIDNLGNLVTKPTEEYTNEQGKKNIRQSSTIAGVYSSANKKTSNTYNYNEKTETDIINKFNDLLQDPDIRASLLQEFDNMLWLYNEASSIIDNPNSTEDDIKQARADLNRASKTIFNKDGIIYSDDDKGFESWLNDQAKQYAKHSAYKHITTSTTDDYTIGYDINTLNNVRNNQQKVEGTKYEYTHSTTEGPSVKKFFDGTSPKNYEASNVMSLIYQQEDNNQQ